MKFKRIEKLALIILLLFAMATDIAVPAKAKIYIALNDSVAEVPGQQTPSTPAAIIKNSYNSTDKQEVSVLLEQKKFSVSNSEVSMKVHEKGNGVLIEGNNSSIAESRFTFGEEIDFGTQSPGYIVADGLAGKKKNLELKFYIDDEKEAFVSLKLNCLKRKDYWNYIKNTCGRIEGKNITGRHKVSFKAVTEDTGNIKFLLRYIFFVNNDIPVINFNIDESQGTISEMNGDQNHNTECYGKVSVEVPDNYKSEYTNKKSKSGTYELEYIRGRGNSTWASGKKPYKFKLAASTDFFGMGKNKHWILLANYYDTSMIRNKLTYWLGEEMGMKYTPQCVFTDVIMNGQYMGSYYLCEQVRVGKSRVNIDDLEADDAAKNITTGAAITGGYLLGMSPYTMNDSMGQTFSTEKGNSYVIESPGFDNYFNEAQYNYIWQYMQKTEDAIYGKDFKDKDGRHYSEYMDIDAAVDYYWMQEISNNGDAFYSSSTYLYKERNGKLFWGPLWDFDYVAWGNTDPGIKGFSKINSTWFERLTKDKTFAEKLIARWPAFKEKLLEACKDGGQIDKYAKQLYNSQKANFNVTGLYSGNIFDSDVLIEDENGVHIEAVDTGGGNNINKTFDNEVARLKKWIDRRTEWIDSNIDSLYPVYCKLTYMSDGKVYKEDTYIKNSINGIVFPEPPVKKGYVFKGWHVKEKADGKEQESLLNAGADVDKDTILYAKWVKESDIVNADKIVFETDEIYCYPHDINMMSSLYTIPFNAEVKEVTYKTSDESVAKVLQDEFSGDYILYTYKEGDATITATTKDGLEATCLVHVTGYEANPGLYEPGFSLDKKKITVDKGSYTRITPRYTYEKATFLSYKFATSDENIVEVNGAGYIYAKKEGTAYIGVSCNQAGGIRFCKIIVKDKSKKKNNKKDKKKNVKKVQIKT